jgi:hypothetical protein
VFLTLFIVVARPLVLAFGLPEMLMISILGLSMVAVLAGRVALKGLAAAGLGMLIGTIGVADAGGSLRMASYDFPYLTDGLQLVIVGLGIFAVPEIVSLLRQDRSIAKDAALGAGWMDGVRDWFANKWLSVRCSLIGVVVGVIPGLGGSVVDWIAYGHAVQTTKDKSQFGKGEIRGVIGPESSNNAKEGGGLVPTLLFGIPGSGSMAIFIGAIALLGSGDIEVGPAMLILLVQMILRPEGDTIFADKEASGEDADAPYGLWGTLAWFPGLIAATYFVGFILALAGFLVIFLMGACPGPLAQTLILTACGLTLMCVCVCALREARLPLPARVGASSDFLHHLFAEDLGRGSPSEAFAGRVVELVAESLSWQRRHAALEAIGGAAGLCSRQCLSARARRGHRTTFGFRAEPAGAAMTRTPCRGRR